MPMTVEADVLVVADDAEIVRLVTEALSERGLRACVRGAAQAGPELAERPWDLIVADLAADSDVLAFVRRARRHRPETPAIVLRGQGVCGEGLLRLPTHVEVLDRPPAASSLRELLQTLLPNHPVPLAAVAADEGGHVCPIAELST